MESPTDTKKQPLVNRLGFFVLGGVCSTVLNKNLLALAQHYWGWPIFAGYAFSASSTAVIFFLWSYFINFRTTVAWANCLGRYAAVFLLALLMNYLIGVCGLTKFGSKGLVAYLVIGAVQSFTGGVKFLLYHFWVFPHAGAPAKAPESATA